MSWKDPNELVVASNGEIYVAPVGTTLPTSPTASLNAAFVGLGYATEDGVTLSVEPEIAEFMSWQSRQPTRRELVAQSIQASFGLQQWNEDTVPLAFGGGAITALGGDSYRYDFPTGSAALDERAMVIDATDGAKKYRYVFARGNVTDAVETQLVRTELAVLPISFKALEPTTGGVAAYLLTNDPAFTPGS